jgi:hypothetical protein
LQEIILLKKFICENFNFGPFLGNTKSENTNQRELALKRKGGGKNGHYLSCSDNLGCTLDTGYFKPFGSQDRSSLG